MFLDTLSATVLQLCSLRKWSYEIAAERCDLSARYFGDIARGRTAPTIKTLEKLCTGFQLLPNDLLVEPVMLQEMMFRLPQDVVQCTRYISRIGYSVYPVCPRCHRTFEREYQAFCDRCGQRLRWRSYAIEENCPDAPEEPGA